MSTEPRRLDLSPYLRRQPVTLALLTALMVVFFLAVTALARVHDSQRESLAERWAQRGVDSLNTGKYRPAVEDFRTALLYSRDNGAYQLSLAEALMGLKRDDEAEAYLVNLWEREPDNGMVSLELARIAVSKNQTEQALRYYHNAIYGTWAIRCRHQSPPHASGTHRLPDAHRRPPPGRGGDDRSGCDGGRQCHRAGADGRNVRQSGG